MDAREPRPDRPSYEELERIVGEQARRIAELEKRVEELLRAGKRQAAPFRKEESGEQLGKAKRRQKKKPGRKAGEAYGEHRRGEEPLGEPDEVHRATLPPSCPDCDSKRLETTKVVTQTQVELPARPIVRRFDIEVGKCISCGKRVHGRHELQTSDSIGAAKHQFGSRAHAAITWLNKRLGLSHGKVAELFGRLFGVKINRSTSCRSMLRSAQQSERAEEEARALVRGSPAITADETGWRVGGRNAWLHDFATDQATAYAIGRRNADALSELIGWDWRGVLVHDGWAVYDAFTRAEHQTCLAHLLRRCDELLAVATRGAVRFPQAVKGLLKQALAVRDRFFANGLTEHGVATRRGRLQAELDRLVTPVKSHTANERLAKFLRAHADQLFTFLRPEFLGVVDATNWRAEQAIRPAVVNRKVWGGNRTDRGANAQATLSTVLVTLAQQAIDPVDWLARTRRSAIPLPLTG
jgi:transposase